MIPSIDTCLVLATGDFSLTILPHLGGKIASVRVMGQELLQSPLTLYGARDREIPFAASDAGGWDECLPSIAECQLETEAGSVSVPDHGDLWRVVWQLIASSPQSATLRAQCFSLPLTLERTLSVSEIGTGWRLNAEYSLTNTGRYSAPWVWAAHPLFAVEAGDRIVLPELIHAVRVEGSRRNRLGVGNSVVAWPTAVEADGSNTDLTVVQDPESGIGDKLFAGPLDVAENWCALERSSAGMRIRLQFDPAATPYLGLWLCYGGWPERPGPKQMCVALEPATAPVDSLARMGPWSRVLGPGEVCRWSMTVDFEPM